MLAAAIATYLTIGALYGLLLVLRVRRSHIISFEDSAVLFMMMTVGHPFMIAGMIRAVPDDVLEE